MGGEAGFTNQFEGEKIGVQKKKNPTEAQPKTMGCDTEQKG